MRPPYSGRKNTKRPKIRKRRVGKRKIAPAIVAEEEPARVNVAHRLRKTQDNVNTDYIISGRYKFRIRDPRELAEHVFEDIEENFCKKVKEGDFLVSGENFGCGSSREQAPAALKAAGIRAVIAKSFARIFYRNSLNLGLYLLECNTNYIDDGDVLELDLEGNIIKNKSKGLNIAFKAIPPLAKRVLAEGGMIEFFKKYGEAWIDA